MTKTLVTTLRIGSWIRGRVITTNEYTQKGGFCCDIILIYIYTLYFL